jgi:hypothetical protein
MRGTDDLLEEQKPRRRRKLRGRAQPYRPVNRVPGPALDAMLRGAPTFLPNPMDATRRAQKRRR